MTCSTPPGSATTRRGRRSRTSGSAPAATPSGAGLRCCAGCATRAPTRATARSTWWWRRSARCCSPRCRGWPTWSRSSSPSATAPTSTTSYGGCPTRRTPASTWSRSAASSRCAAASSTSSRPPRSTRCGWSSSATTSTRSARSRSPTSAPSSRSPRLWAPPCRELLLTDDVRRRAKALGAEHPELAELTDRMAEGVAVEGMESLAPVLVDEMEMLVDLLPAESHVLLLDPERVRTRAHDLVATCEEFLGASWAAAAGGGQAPIDLGAASLREIGDVRQDVLAQGKAWWSVSPFGLDDDTDEASRVVDVRPAEEYRGDVERAVADIRGWVADGHPGRAAQRGPRPGAADGRGARRARRAGQAGRRLVSTGSTADGCSPASSPSPAPPSTTGSSTRPCGSRCSPARTFSASARPRGTCARCRPGARSRSTRWSSKAGDYVVHEQHGVGRFVEMKQREFQGAVREYLVLEYGSSKRGQPADRLSCPPTRSTRSRATSAASSRRSTASAAATGPSARVAPARRCARSPPS